MTYNKNFELSINDIDIIEFSLLSEVKNLSLQRLEFLKINNTDQIKEIDLQIEKIQNLLGRLHNQKTWYRPKGLYIGG